MSDQYPIYSLLWHQCRAKVHHIVHKHHSGLLRIDLQILQPYIEARGLLERAERDQVWDTTKPADERKIKLVNYVCQKRGTSHHNSLYGLECLIGCLRASGEEKGHSEHTTLARDLAGDLTVQPEEVVNEREYELMKKYKYAELLVAIKRKFRAILPEDSIQFEIFKEFAARVTSGTHKLTIQIATTTDVVFRELSSGNYISETNISLLESLLKFYGKEEASDEKYKLEEFDLQFSFAKFSHEIASKLAVEITAVELKICTLCTVVRFGCYYKKLEQEEEVKMIVRTLQDWKYPELLRRVVRHFHAEELRWLDEYRERMKSTSRQLSVAPETEGLYLSHLENYADLLRQVHELLKSDTERAEEFLSHVSSLGLSTDNPSLKLITDPHTTTSNALLALLPFTSYHNTYLIEHIVNNFCNDTLLKALLSRSAEWKQFINSTFIADVYDVQLNCLPLQLTERNIATLTLHMRGEQWKNPKFQHVLDLALETAVEFHLQQWSVVYLRTVLTETEPGSKGDCKVEMLVPSMAACIILRDGGNKRRYWQKHSVTYLELYMEGRCYLSDEVRNITHMLERAQLQEYFSSYLEELNNT